MAGGFTHMNLVDSLCDESVLAHIPTLTKSMRCALLEYRNFVEMGAVSPDYPYLTDASFDKNSQGWANVMHYWKTMDVVRNAVPLIRAMEDIGTNAAKKKCTAWLFGYLAHVVTDYTIHPVIFMKVGPYKENKIHHRICEMNQDVYIHNKLTHLDLHTDGYLLFGGISSCGIEGDQHRLEPAVVTLWKACLPAVPGTVSSIGDGFPVPTSAADPDDWHSDYVNMIDVGASAGNVLPQFARRFVGDEALVYPQLNNLDHSYIDGLDTPRGLMSFDDIFSYAKATLTTAWGQLGTALGTGDVNALRISDGDLDTGRDEANNYIFWQEAT